MRFLLISFVLGTLLISSCKKLELDKIKEASWNPKFATPLAYGKFTVKDMLIKFDSAGMIKTNNGELSIVTTSNFPAFDASTFVTLPTVSQTLYLAPSQLSVIGSATPPFNVIPAGNLISTSSTMTQIVDFPVTNGEEISTVNFKKGDMEITLASDLKHDIELALSFPDFIVGGEVLVDTVRLIYAYDNQPMTKKIKFSLDGAKADFTNGGTSVNKIRVNANGKLIGTGEVVDGDEYLNLTFAIKNLAFNEIKGYFGKMSVGNPMDSILINQFETFNIKKGMIGLTNPSIKMNITNTFGFPLELAMDELSFKELAGGGKVNMVHNPLKETINYPLYANKGVPAKTTIAINTANTTNLDKLITTTSKYFYVKTAATTNPLGKAGDPLNYLLGTSKMTVDAEIEIPMDGFATGFERFDTIEVGENFSDLENSLKSIIIRLVLDNGFPLNIDGSLYFIDDNGNPIKNNGILIDLLKLNPTILASGKLDGSGKVIESTTTINDIALTSDLFPLLKTAKKMVFKTSIGSEGGASKKSVKLFDSYTIAFKLGINIQAGLKSGNK